MPAKFPTTQAEILHAAMCAAWDAPWDGDEIPSPIALSWLQSACGTRVSLSNAREVQAALFPTAIVQPHTIYGYTDQELVKATMPDKSTIIFSRSTVICTEGAGA